MFATLLGGLPRPPLPEDAAREEILDAILEVQAIHGIEPSTDAGWELVPGDPVASWRGASARAGDGLTKAVVVGPFSSGATVVDVRATLLGLAEAGCRWVEIHEPAAITIGTDPDARARFVDLHRRLTTDLSPELHLSLAIVGGSAEEAGIGTILADAYRSLAVDLIDGPDNWRLVAATPSDRGIICGALSTRAGSDDGPEMLLWAAGYAASTASRGPERVGLATAGSLAPLAWDVAVGKLERLGAAARLADAPVEVRKAAIDPRAVDIRSAAVGRYEPGVTRRARKPRA